MNFAISTQSVSDSTETAINAISEMGIEWVEINLQTDEFAYGAKRRPNAKFYKSLKGAIDTAGLKVWSVTAPKLTPEQMFSERARREILLNGIGAAGVLGAKTFVVEPVHILGGENSAETYLNADKLLTPPIIDGFDEAWAQIVNRRMGFSLLNKQYFLGQPLTNQADDLAKITEDLGIQTALDIDSASQRGTLESWAEKLTDRLTHIVVSDTAEISGLKKVFEKTRAKTIVLDSKTPLEPNWSLEIQP